MRTALRWAAWPLAAVCAAAAVALTGGCEHLSSRAGFEAEDEPLPALRGPRGAVGESTVGDDPTMKALACDLDHLEKHIDCYGSVTAKVPDVWGQARLTQYRDEFEKVMAAEKDNFIFTLQGQLSRSDSAYFASATALSFAAQPKPPLVGTVKSDKNAAPQLVPTAQTVRQVGADVAAGTVTGTNTAYGLPPSAPAAKSPDAVKPLDVADPNTLVSSSDTVLGKRNDARLQTALPFGQAAGAVGIEPTEFLAQKKRYLDFLNQLRRENEGDDTADSPGYSLNLIRIPVSVLPGKTTDVGHGAEITMSINPILGDDLLPATMRNLITNDVVNQLGLPVTQVIGTEKVFDEFLNEDFERFMHVVTRLNDYESDPDGKWGGQRALALATYLATDKRADDDRRVLREYASPQMLDYLREKYSYDAKAGGVLAGATKVAVGDQAAQRQFAPTKVTQLIRGTLAARKVKIPLDFDIQTPSFSNGLENRTALNASQLLDAYGPEMLFDILYAAGQAHGDTVTRQKYAHLPDVQSYLRDEVRAAGRFLQKNPTLWTKHCTDGLVEAIHSQRWDEVTRLRQDFRKDVAILTGSEPDGSDPAKLTTFDPTAPAAHLSRTTALAWVKIVDAAILNARLIQDMKETATAKNQPLSGCDHWCQYFLPEPNEECRRQFNAYVKLRWPIHVFALDPYTQEQNVADSLSTRRETQLALAIAFTNGQISARNLTKYTRRLEAEYETVSLNRTQVGFSHGENTFGWRFYPRFQTPETKGNLETFFREQLVGERDKERLLRDSRLEPGERECVAVVMMPSFVPYVNVETVSNWFSLNDPKHKKLNLAHALKLSGAVQAIRTGGGGVKDACKYRPGEYERLYNRADQLDARLPTQTLTSAVPILNTLGGFEMFANGTTDLAPELFGWYGAPGIDPEEPVTTLFLVGDHFSPLRTHVIVGNQAVNSMAAPAGQPPAQLLLSRQVMQVTFGKGAYQVVPPPGNGPATVRIHVATPYGVTRELDVPVIARKPAPPAKPGVNVPADAKMVVCVVDTKGPAKADGAAGEAKAADKGKRFVAVAPGPDTLKLKWVGLDPTAVIVKEFRVRFVFGVPDADGKPQPVALPCCDGVKATFALDAPKDVASASNAGTLVLDKACLARFAADLVRQPWVQKLAEDGKLNSLTTTSVVVTAMEPKDPAKPDGEKAPGRSVTANDQLTVTFAPGTDCKDGVLKESDCKDGALRNDCLPKKDEPKPEAKKDEPKTEAKPTAKFEREGDGPVAVRYCKDAAGQGRFRLGLMELADDARLRLKWVPQKGLDSPKAITAECEFEYQKCKLLVPVRMAQKGTSGVYESAADPKDKATWAEEWVSGLLRQLNGFGPFTNDTNPLAQVNPGTWTIGPQFKGLRVTAVDGRAVSILPSPKARKVKYECRICDPAEKPVVPGAEDAKPAEPKADDKKPAPHSPAGEGDAAEPPVVQAAAAIPSTADAARPAAVGAFIAHCDAPRCGPLVAAPRSCPAALPVAVIPPR